MLHLVATFLLLFVIFTFFTSGILAVKDESGTFRLTRATKRSSLLFGLLLATVITFFVGTM